MSVSATIPIVFALAVDAAADGLAASFARPDGNLTGLTMAAGYSLLWGLKRRRQRNQRRVDTIRQGVDRLAVFGLQILDRPLNGPPSFRSSCLRESGGNVLTSSPMALSCLSLILSTVELSRSIADSM